MKKLIYTAPLFAILMAGMILTGCQTPAQKEDAAKENVQNAKEELKDAKQEVNAEYPAFKRDAEVQINANETRIATLREKLNASGGKAPLDPMRKQRIDDLEKRNAELRSRLYGYEKERSDWETFKAGFNADMRKLDNAFTDFGNDLKK